MNKIRLLNRAEMKNITGGFSAMDVCETMQVPPHILCPPDTPYRIHCTDNPNDYFCYDHCNQLPFFPICGGEYYACCLDQ